MVTSDHQLICIAKKVASKCQITACKEALAGTTICGKEKRSSQKIAKSLSLIG
jgi:hypothetical protein